VRLWQVGDLSDSLAEARSREAARADPDRRLDDLEAGSLRVRPRVEEAEDASAAVGLDPGCEKSGGESESGRHEDAPARNTRRGQPAIQAPASNITAGVFTRTWAAMVAASVHASARLARASTSNSCAHPIAITGARNANIRPVSVATVDAASPPSSSAANRASIFSRYARGT